ncbi:MAG TPA: ATP phosphoribosyltransferase regulatory subunit [Thermoleophilaceae bacterium]|nr:ATP phosphoribosyltransferase regulatory subunit [Thermoleophilaceae bacterium]
MIHPVPPGTRDVLPDEMRELRALSASLHTSFDGAGYGEVWTPALEYEEVLRLGDDRAGGAGFRLFDDRGSVLALRSDATIPIARLVANRYTGQPGPLRLAYFAHAYRAVERGSGQAREFLQGGIELIGVGGAEGDAEVIALVVQALSETGLRRHRIGLGDAMLYRGLLLEAGVSDDAAAPLLEALWRRDLVALEHRVDELGLAPAARAALVELPTLRGGPEVLSRAAGPGAENLRAVHDLLAERGVADRVIFDLGLLRDLGYYTGTIFEVLDPAVAFPLGGGGRYDELLGRFGEARPACGAGLDLQRVHVAQIEEERGR